MLSYIDIMVSNLQEDTAVDVFPNHEEQNTAKLYIYIYIYIYICKQHKINNFKILSFKLATSNPHLQTETQIWKVKIFMIFINTQVCIY